MARRSSRCAARFTPRDRRDILATIRVAKKVRGGTKALTGLQRKVSPTPKGCLTASDKRALLGALDTVQTRMDLKPRNIYPRAERLREKYLAHTL